MTSWSIAPSLVVTIEAATFACATYEIRNIRNGPQCVCEIFFSWDGASLTPYKHAPKYDRCWSWSNGKSVCKADMLIEAKHLRPRSRPEL